MKKEITAEYMHQLLKEEVFRDIDLSKVGSMSDEERRQLTISVTDQMLSQRAYGETVGWYISQFLDVNEEPRKDNPLYQEKSAVVDWYVELAVFCNALYTHVPIDLNSIEPGMAQYPDEPEQDYTIDNQRLVGWLRETPFRRVAMLVARIMLDREFERVVGVFDAVQDYYAEHCTTNTINTQDAAKCEAFIHSVLDSIKTVCQHQQQGRELGLNDEELRIVDALWGWMPHPYEPPYVDAAREIYQTVEANLPSPTTIRSRNGFMIFKKPLMEKFETVVRKYDLDIDLTDTYNITIGYLTEWLWVKYMGDQLPYDNPLDEYHEL